jgi:hypothetical protein
MRQILRHPSLAAGAGLCFKPVYQVHDGEEPAAGAIADTGARDGNREVGLAGARAADQHDVALMRQELAASQVAHQGLVDRRAIEGEVVDVLGQRQLGNGDLVADGPRLLLADLSRQQVAHDARRLVLALDRGADDLVVCGFHAVQLQLRHGVQDLGSFN